mmetsp:Transcript_133493/g.426916  ORF Transcript_133493/g.426916 Transcript_133493/m.426916 type:complete len:84 (+) Transcript_133493:553-804(+)
MCVCGRPAPLATMPCSSRKVEAEGRFFSKAASVPQGSAGTLGSWPGGRGEAVPRVDPPAPRGDALHGIDGAEHRGSSAVRPRV